MSSQADQIPSLPLGANEQIPQLGFGVFQVPLRETEEVVEIGRASCRERV